MSYEDPNLTPLNDFDTAWREIQPKKRLKAIRSGAECVRERMLRCRSVPYYRSFDLVRFAHFALYT